MNQKVKTKRSLFGIVLGISAYMCSMGASAQSLGGIDIDDYIVPYLNEVVEFGPPGEAIFDATNHIELLPEMEQGLFFEDREALVEYLVDNFNAEPILDEQGNAVGARGFLVNYGQQYTKQLGEIVPVDDPLLYLLGGPEGSFQIDDEIFELRIPQIAPWQPRLSGSSINGGSTLSWPSSIEACNNDGDMCIRGSAFKKDWLVYKSIGTTVTQEKGGYSEEWKFCWKYGWIPWACKEKKGSNNLSTNATFYTRFSSSYYPIQAVDYKVKERDNTESVTVKHWSIFGELEVALDSESGFGPVTGGGAGSPATVKLVGVSGCQRGTVGWDTINTCVKKGSVPRQRYD